MYLKRILLIVVFLGLLLGGLFAAMVYRTFFSPNTAFSNAEAYVFIPTGAGYEALKPQLAPLLKLKLWVGCFRSGFPKAQGAIRISGWKARPNLFLKGNCRETPKRHP
ncbi:MAG: hypothetical protein R3252_11415, partial [Robiginitalea sp.]|nr:hypothetical protein [Robiginitalea sp.]